jgi:hypothetical protein
MHELIDHGSLPALESLRKFIRKHSDWNPTLDQVAQMAELAKKINFEKALDELAYEFVLRDSRRFIMSTVLPEPDPRLDLVFWERFMQGDVSMKSFLKIRDTSGDVNYGAHIPTLIAMLDSGEILTKRRKK